MSGPSFGGPLKSAASGASNLANGRQIVASRLANTAQNLGLGNPFQTYRNKHTALVACADVRLGFAAPLEKEFDHTYPTVIKAGIETSGGTVLPLTFNGKQSALLEPGGRLQVSAPAPIELSAGDTFWTRVLTGTPFGYFLTVDATVLSGVTSIPIRNTAVSTGAAAGLANTMSNPLGKGGRTALNPIDGYLGPATLDSGANVETVTIVGWEWDAANTRWNMIVQAATTKGHSAGANVGQFPFINAYGYGDLGEGAASSGNTAASNDLSWVTTAIAAWSSLSTTTLINNQSIGDTSFQVGNPLQAGTSFTVDTAGNAETVTVKTIQGVSSPYTVQLTGGLTKNHTAGATVTGGIADGFTMRPTLITADRIDATAKPPKTIVVLGDSLPSGTGYNIRQERSFVTLALEGHNPYFLPTLAGESAQQFAPLSGRPRRSVMLALGDWALYQYGVNDIYGGRVLAQLQADSQTIWAAAKKRGLKVAVCTLTPRTTSTDLWATTGNQTIVNSASSNVVRIAYNNWLRNNSPASLGFDLLIETADTVESGRDSGLWKADASGPYTADGIHPTSLGHPLLAAAINPALFA